MPLTEHERREALGKWGEKKALILLKNARFNGVKDVNAQTHNHPFGDIYAEFASKRFVIGVKTRNMYQKSGPLNASYNVLKKGFDVWAVGRRYKADLAWVAIQVIPELQTFNAYFGTIDKIQEYKERFSIPMKPDEIRDYKYMRLGGEDEFDPAIRPEWSNGGISHIARAHRQPRDRGPLRLRIVCRMAIRRAGCPTTSTSAEGKRKRESGSSPWKSTSATCADCQGWR